MFVLVAFKGCITLEVKDTVSFTNCNWAGTHGDDLTIGCLDTTRDHLMQLCGEWLLGGVNAFNSNWMNQKVHYECSLSVINTPWHISPEVLRGFKKCCVSRTVVASDDMTVQSLGC